MCKKKIISQEQYDMILSSYLDSIKKRRDIESRLHIYEESQGMTFYDLVNEAMVQERERVPLYELKLYDRLMDFRKTIMATRKFSTANIYLTSIKTLYKRFRVNVPDLPAPNRLQGTHTETIEYEDIITLDEIKQALALSNKCIKARCMAMITGGYSFDETQHMTIRNFIDENYRHHQCDDDEDALIYMAEHDNLIWLSKARRWKTGKVYFGFTNPETTQEIANYVLSSQYQERDELFEYQYNWVVSLMGRTSEQLNFRKVGDRKLFRCHMLRKYNATHLAGDRNSKYRLNPYEVDELQGRSKTNLQDTYMKTDRFDIELLYAKAMNNVSIYNQYEHWVEGDRIMVECTTSEKVLKNKLDKLTKPTDGLRNYILEVGEDNFIKQVNNLANLGSSK